MNDTLREFIQKSEAYLSSEEKTNALKEDKENITSKIESILKKDETLKNYMLNGRVKKQDSLKEKIIRKPKIYEDSKGNAETFIDTVLDDIIGIRIICLLNDDEDKVYKVLQSYFSKKVPLGPDDAEYLVADSEDTEYPYLAYSYEKQPVPQKNGKGIYKLKLKYFKDKHEYTNIELQIKSLTHMFWGELEHMLFYKNYRYTLDNEFYSKMMFSINSILEALDIQLKDIQSHLSKNDKIKDTKDMMTKILYNCLHDEIKKLYDTELDLREVYTLISQLYFYKHSNYNDALTCSKDLFEAIANMEIQGDLFNFSQIDIIDNLKPDIKEYIKLLEDQSFFNDDTVDILNELAVNIQKLTKGNDIFWGCLISIYIHLLNKEDVSLADNYKLAILDMTYNLMNSFSRKYTTEFELIDLPENMVLLNNILLESLNKCFINYNKLDFFIETGHQDSISNIFSQFISAHIDELEEVNLTDTGELSTTERTIIIDIISKVIEIQINYQLYGNLNFEELQQLIDILPKETTIELSWIPRIHTQNLERITEKKIEINNLSEFQSYIYMEEEQTDAL
ncbi:hypothetical protein [Bacillus cereus]|uniref:hypothetical protein n=1 Tax=Bacillus cereus TaxID=1396 RepID=UPI00190BAFF6|nr:hypothetical protein [Bacillus cereus]MBK4742080.1 hypothetical protein [Bacillus cereus]